MATRTEDSTTAQDNTKNGKSTDGSSRAAAVGGAVSEAASTAKVAAGDAVSRLPEVAATTRSAFEDANRQIRSGSDEMLSVGSVLSFGFAMGLLVGGANRLLIAAALVPTAMMGLTLLDRSSRSRKSTPRSV